MSYISSIVTRSSMLTPDRYGDAENVEKDAKTIAEILSRQGSSLLIDALSHHSGKIANQLKLNESDRKWLLNSLVEELKNALGRIGRL